MQSCGGGSGGGGSALTARICRLPVNLNQPAVNCQTNSMRGQPTA